MRRVARRAGAIWLAAALVRADRHHHRLRAGLALGVTFARRQDDVRRRRHGRPQLREPVPAVRHDRGVRRRADVRQPDRPVAEGLRAGSRSWPTLGRQRRPADVDVPSPGRPDVERRRPDHGAGLRVDEQLHHRARHQLVERRLHVHGEHRGRRRSDDRVEDGPADAGPGLALVQPDPPGAHLGRLHRQGAEELQELPGPRDLGLVQPGRVEAGRVLPDGGQPRLLARRRRSSTRSSSASTTRTNRSCRRC